MQIPDLNGRGRPCLHGEAGCRFKSPKHEDAAICGSKSAESECFQKCGSCEAAEQFVGIVDNADTQRSNLQVL